jgi:hypothetical protein
VIVEHRKYATRLLRTNSLQTVQRMGFWNNDGGG